MRPTSHVKVSTEVQCYCFHCDLLLLSADAEALASWFAVVPFNEDVTLASMPQVRLQMHSEDIRSDEAW